MQQDPVIVARFYYRHEAEFAKATRQTVDFVRMTLES